MVYGNSFANITSSDFWEPRGETVSCGTNLFHSTKVLISSFQPMPQKNDQNISDKNKLGMA